MRRIYLGFDEIIFECDDLISFLQQAKRQHLPIFHLNEIAHHTYQFYIPIYLRYKTYKLHLPIRRSIGIFAYLLKSLTFPYLLSTLSFALTLYFCCQVIWYYRIDGTLPQVNQELEALLDDKIGDIKDYQDINRLYALIKKQYKTSIDYLNLYLQGGILYLHYTPARIHQESKPQFTNYIASKDGVICQIDVEKGNVLVDKHQFVKKGDVLISNTIISTNNQNKMIETKGKIYAYTCYIKEARCKPIQKEGIAYLLYKIRASLPINVKIDKEKIIDYAIIDNELVLKMQYTCIENIAIREKK